MWPVVITAVGVTAMILFCRACDGENEFPRHWVTPDDACKFCGSKEHWRTRNEPKVPYDLNTNDKRWLKSVKIAAD